MNSFIKMYLQFSEKYLPKLYITCFVLSLIALLGLVSIESERLLSSSTNLPLTKGQIILEILPAKLEKAENSVREIHLIEDELSLNQSSQSSMRLSFEIPSETLLQAQKLKLNNLCLGQFLGIVKVFYETKDIYGRENAKTRFPLCIPITNIQVIEEEFAQFVVYTHPTNSTIGTRARVSIRDYFGFVSSERFSEIQESFYFRFDLYPYLLSLVFLILGLVFYLTYRLQTAWKDSLTLSGFFWIESLLSALQTNSLFQFIADDLWIRALLALRVFECFAVLSLALRFARHNRPWISGLNLFVFSSTLIYLIFAEDVVIQSQIYIVSNYLLPVTLLSSAILLFFRALQLDPLADGSQRLGHRQDRLIGFGTAYVVIAVISFFFGRSEEINLFSSQLNQAFYIFFGILYGQIIYKELARVNVGSWQNPKSEYHQIENSIEALSGWVFMIDLKKSEILFRKGANFGQGGQLVLDCISQIWRLLNEQGAIVLQCEGDSVLAFFKADENLNLKKVLNTINKLNGLIINYESELQNRSIFREGEIQLKFRSALCPGEIRPVFRELEGQSIPSWAEAGSTNPFVECSRLLEADRDLPDSLKALSTLIIAEEIIAKEMNHLNQEGFPVFLKPYITKSGKKTKITVFTPRLSSSVFPENEQNEYLDL